MKRIGVFWLLLGFISYVTVANAQSSLILEASQLFTSFKYTDSQGNSLNSEYSGIFTGAYEAGYRFVTDGGLMFNAGIGMRKAGATLIYDEMNYKWDLQYANARMGAGYMLKKDLVSPYLNVSGYYAYMLRGYQTINNEDFNIKESESINVSDYGVIINPGLQIAVSDVISTFFEFNYLMGFKNLEKDEDQKAKNFAYGLTFGLAFSFAE